MDRPDVQTMAMMQAFPNLMNFSKTGYGYEHYLVSTALAGSLADMDGNGIIDVAAPLTVQAVRCGSVQSGGA